MQYNQRMRSSVPLVLVILTTLASGSLGFWSVKYPNEEDVLLPNNSTSPGELYEYDPPLPHPFKYGVDVSFPVQYVNMSMNFAYLPHNVHPDQYPTPPEYQGMPISPFGEDRIRLYEEFVRGCQREAGQRHKAKLCIDNEQARTAMSLRQPQSMRNFTTLGFKKIRAPDSLFQLLKKFWEHSKQSKMRPEPQPIGNTYTNNWAAPSHAVLVDDWKLRGNKSLKQEFYDQTEKVLSHWAQQPLKPTSIYGIRVYTTGAILSTHVDRLPLVISAIVNVAQDLDEPWPLEVIGHDGLAYNVTMIPGDMVLYESHSVLHGRPFPLKGRYVANIFIHFEPANATDPANPDALPWYVIPGSPESDFWRTIHAGEGEGHDEEGEEEEDEEEKDSKHGQNHKTLGDHYHDTSTEHAVLPETDNSSSSSGGGANGKVQLQRGPTVAHHAAKEGSVADLAAELGRQKGVVNAMDENGWTPLHAGAHGGHVDVVKLLIANGADKDIRTWYGSGGTALWWAKQVHGNDHPVVEFLESIGAVDAGPEL